MSEQMSLGDILDDAKPNTPEVKETPAIPQEKTPSVALEIPKLGEEPEVERPESKRKKWRDREQDAQGRVRDHETGQYLSKEEKKAETTPKKEEPAKPETAKPAPVAAPQQDFTDKEKAFQRAMLEERSKRQELERRLQAIETAKPKVDGGEPAKTTFWDDPEGTLARDKAERQKDAFSAKLGLAEFIARQKHTDFDEKIAVFEKIVQQTPGLPQQWLSAPDPAEFAYTIGKNHMELEQAGSIDELRANIEKDTEARVRLKLEAELKEKAEALAKERAALPPSLSEARSTGVNKPVWSGATPLDDILSG